MTKSELEDYKKELMRPGWTEDLYNALKELPQEDAKQIIESMSDNEIYSKVNNRNMQGDYIADYLEYLWDISEPAFWKHTIATLDLKEGFLWSDHMPHFEKMSTNDISDEVMNAIINFAIGVEVKGDYLQDYEIIGCVIKAQVENFNRLDYINKYISLLDIKIQPIAQKIISEMIKCECKY